MNLSNDIVDFPLFRVIATGMKTGLSHQAFKIKDKLQKQVSEWCKNSVIRIFNTYEHMMVTIEKEPTNERELVETRDFIKDTPNKVERQIQDLNDVYKHYCMLEDFSFKCEDNDIEMFWMQK